MPTARATGYAALLALALWAPSAGHAADGSLTVTVRDNYGVIPRATVRATNGAGAQRAVTDDSGVARFATLPAGTYEVRAVYPGFADAVQAGVTLAEGEAKALDLVLAVAQLSTTVTVETANRREQLLLDVAEPVTLIEKTQIEDTGARSAKDVLVEQSGSGIQVNAGGGQGYVSINGIPNKGVLVLVNGRRYLGKDANGNLNLEELQLLGLERIEVVKGPGSALYGSDAVGGVVNFIISPPYAGGTTNALKMSGGSNSDYRVDDVFSWRGNRAGAKLAVGYRTYDGFDLESCSAEEAAAGTCKPNPQTVGQPPSDYWNGLGVADFEISKKVVARFFGNYQLRKVRDYFFSGATQLASTVYDSQRDLTRYMLSPEVDFLLSPRASVNATYTYGKYLRDETRVFVSDGRVVPQPDWREWNQEAKLTGRYTFAAFGREHPLQGGYEYRRERLRRGTLSVTDPARDINVLWGQQELNVTARLKVAAGVRYDSYSDFGAEWSPKAEAVFTVAPEHRLRASYGHGFRPPYFGELYLQQPPFFVGNPDLVPEVSDGFTGGYAFASGKAQVSVDGYYTKVKNGIIFFQLTPSQFTYRNVDRYVSKGVNVAAAVSLAWGFTPSVAYAYNRREDPEGAEVGGYPNHSAFVKLLWANPRLGLRANVRGQINGKVPPGVDGTYQPAYDLWSAHVSKRFATLGAHGISLYAQVDNIFDKSDIFLANPDGTPVQGQFQVWLAPRTFQAGVTLDMDWTK
ncbi:MAG TPA: TonB-dependent receptor [Vicinamibacteria bacterium]|nr:TonB-dependent receptor [Vicinamibacteria bacterium]